MRYFLFLLLWTCLYTATYAYGYSDYDVDGVEDSIDECLNTPFDVLVDERGCSEEVVYYGELTLSTGILSAVDSESSTITNVQFFANYRYKDWDMSFSTFNDIQHAIENVPNTYYVNTGYRFKLSNTLQTKVSVGTKQSSVQNDYYMATNVDYSINEKQNVFLFYSYTIAQDSNTTKYDNFHTISFGTGRILSEHWYSAISYDFSGASLPETKAYKAVTWSNTLMFSSKYFLLATYSYGLSDAASDHILGIQFGVKFE